MSFLLKAKRFFKKNVYPITVSLCTVLVLGIITISAYTSIKNSNEIVKTSQKIEGNEQTPNVSDEENSKPSASAETIIFDLPFDKAGAYGIQEWIGMVAVEELRGSFFNVMGLPMQRLYNVLKTF